MTHVIINLIKNAVEAMEENVTEKLLEISANQQNHVYLLRVRDTGCGMSEEVRKQIFTYGFTTKTNGNGFGLFTCQQIMSELDGDISVSSPGPGQGS